MTEITNGILTWDEFQANEAIMVKNIIASFQDAQNDHNDSSTPNFVVRFYGLDDVTEDSSLHLIYRVNDNAVPGTIAYFFSEQSDGFANTLSHCESEYNEYSIDPDDIDPDDIESYNEFFAYNSLIFIIFTADSEFDSPATKAKFWIEDRKGEESRVLVSVSYPPFPQLDSPTNFGSSSRTVTSITLSWTAVENATSYEIARCDSSGTTTYETKTATGTSVSFTGLSQGTTYYFKIKAVGDGADYSDSEYSSVVSAKTQATLLDTPTGLTVTNNAVITTKAKSTVSWTAVDNVTSYKLEYKKSSETNWTSVSTTKVSYALTSLARNTSYDFRVTAIGDGTTYFDSDVSSTVTKTTKSQLATPKNLTCTSKTATSLTFSWTAVSGTKKYYLGYKLPSSSSWDYVHPTTNSGTITGLSSGTTYNIRLSAHTPTNSKTYDGSAYTSTINTTTLIPLTAPSNLNASNVTSTSAKVSWNSVNNATGYKVEFRKSGTSSWLVANE